MATRLRSGAGRFTEKPGDGSEESPEEEVEGYEMLLGYSMDSREARDRFIDEVEKLLEFESLERGQQHMRKNFDCAVAQSEMFEVQTR